MNIAADDREFVHNYLVNIGCVFLCHSLACVASTKSPDRPAYSGGLVGDHGVCPCKNSLSVSV